MPLGGWWLAHLPAIGSAAWSCRSQPARRRESACPRFPGVDVRSVWAAAPDLLATGGCRAWSAPADFQASSSSAQANHPTRGVYGYARPSSRARATASVRRWTWSLPKILRLCPFTVSRARKSRSPMSRLDSPAVMSRRTSISR